MASGVAKVLREKVERATNSVLAKGCFTDSRFPTSVSPFPIPVSPFSVPERLARRQRVRNALLGLCHLREFDEVLALEIE